MSEFARFGKVNNNQPFLRPCEPEGHEDPLAELGVLLLEISESPLFARKTPSLDTAEIENNVDLQDLSTISKDILDDLAAGWPTPRSVAPSNPKRGKARKKRDRTHPILETDFNEAIKAMRLGNLDSIQANFRLAKSPRQIPSRPSWNSVAEQRAAHHRDIVTQFNACFALSDTNRLAMFIRDHCHDYVMYLSPHNRDPVIGKGDFMILMSLVIESYPDAVGAISNLEQEENKVRHVVAFSGTKMYPFPIEVVYKQIREHFHAEMDTHFAASGDVHAVNQGLVQAITNKIQCSVAEKLRHRLEEESASDGDSPNVGADPESSWIGTDSHESSAYSLGSAQRSEELADNFLGEELVEFTWQTTFYFDQEDRIVQIISFEV